MLSRTGWSSMSSGTFPGVRRYRALIDGALQRSTIFKSVSVMERRGARALAGAGQGAHANPLQRNEAMVESWPPGHSASSDAEVP